MTASSLACNMFFGWSQTNPAKRHCFHSLTRGNFHLGVQQPDPLKLFFPVQDGEFTPETKRATLFCQVGKHGVDTALVQRSSKRTQHSVVLQNRDCE